MKTLLFLNGPEGWQTGIEDGFSYLHSHGEISELNWFYFEEFAKKKSFSQCIFKMLELANAFLPDLIVFFHIGSFPIEKKNLIKLKGISSKPILVYDEGDMYGGWSKPITSSMKVFFKYTDIISIRGLGKWYETVIKYNKNVIYTPHHADIARFDIKPYKNSAPNNEIILIGNKVKPRFLSKIRRLPGAELREKFAVELGKAFPQNFKLYGNGWENFVGNQGPIDFQQQIEYYKNSLITVAYEHYPKIPYYFSNRLPIALLSGSIYVCHYHKGYEKIFDEGDFIFFFRTNQEAIDIIKYLTSITKENLIERSKRARLFALANYTPEVVWKNFYENILKLN